MKRAEESSSHSQILSDALGTRSGNGQWVDERATQMGSTRSLAIATVAIDILGQMRDGFNKAVYTAL